MEAQSPKKEVRIITFNATKKFRLEEEAEITRLVNEGWKILAGGGFGGVTVGFLALQKG
jgi:shikimate kinase